MPHMFFLANLNLALAVGGVLLAALTILLFLDLYTNQGKYFAQQINDYFWFLVMGVTIGSVALSLLYSEYFGFIPCSLCWLQRIAIYPQALLSVLAFRADDNKLFPVYGIWLSLFGLAVAIYQYVYQMIPPTPNADGPMPCLLDGSNADCATKVIDQFGFVTFPFLAGVTFAFLIALYQYRLRQSQ